MAASCLHLALLLCLIPATVASPRSLRKSPADMVFALDAASRSPAGASGPTTVFEVDRPLRPPPGSSGPCSTRLLSASFGSAFTKPPATAAYTPPRCLAAAGGRASAISLAVLEWRAACRGVQYDRIFGVWLGGAELLRGCTAEPSRDGVAWSVSKDVTRYASLLAAGGESTLAVYLGNSLSSNLTGVYHANVTLHLYFFRRSTPKRPPLATGAADLIVPVSRGLPLDDGLWYKIHSASDVQSATVTLPRNAYRAVLELYVSFHGDDEFWYYKHGASAADGPFREVTVRVDGVLAGAAWPCPVVYTGGFDPLLWRPITGVGSFDLPTYDIELTPLLGKLLNGKPHELGFAVTNALDVWYVDANLHLWLDPGSAATTAGLIGYVAPAANTTSSQSGGPVDTTYHTTAGRYFSAAGWVKSSSYGNVTTNATQTFAFDNTVTFETLSQTTVARAGVRATGHDGRALYTLQTERTFPLLVEYQSGIITVVHGLEETATMSGGGRWSSGPAYRSLRTTQSSTVEEEERGSSRQTYRYEATDRCYSRNVTSSGDRIVSDQSSEVCVKAAGAGLVRN
ncbi:hypothetical protein BS78_03G022400 [Paspalum vaginatum]|nr:hypothetical protein BS78_03G022400 [Paspalum vaginatum]